MKKSTKKTNKKTNKKYINVKNENKNNKKYSKSKRFGMNTTARKVAPIHYQKIHSQLKYNPEQFYHFNDFQVRHFRDIEDSKENYVKFAKFILENQDTINLSNGTFISFGFEEEYGTPNETFYVLEWIDENNIKSTKHISLIQFNADDDTIIPAYDFRDFDTFKTLYGFYEGPVMNPDGTFVFQNQERVLKNGFYEDIENNLENVINKQGELYIKSNNTTSHIEYIDFVEVDNNLQFNGCWWYQSEFDNNNQFINRNIAYISPEEFVEIETGIEFLPDEIVRLDTEDVYDDNIDERMQDNYNDIIGNLFKEIDDESNDDDDDDDDNYD